MVVLHWGTSAWACYALVGLALAFFSYQRGLPLTIWSGLTPLFGKALSGPLGHIVDIVSVIATILGVSVTIGYGAFIQTLVDFLIVALAIFVAIRVINSMQRKEPETPAAPLPPSEELVVLREIRDALKRGD